MLSSNIAVVGRRYRTLEFSQGSILWGSSLSMRTLKSLKFCRRATEGHFRVEKRVCCRVILLFLQRDTEHSIFCRGIACGEFHPLTTLKCLTVCRRATEGHFESSNKGRLGGQIVLEAVCVCVRETSPFPIENMVLLESDASSSGCCRVNIWGVL